MKWSDQVERPDFRLGPLAVSPARRHVEGPAGEIHVEPLVFQAFLLLVDARSNVVTRNELFDRCWGGAMAGDDSLNRAIAGVRRIATVTGPGLFEIETVPRTGYRLIGEITSSEQPSSVVSRRRMLGSAAAVTAAAGGLGLWFVQRSSSDGRFDALMERGEEALRIGGGGDDGAAKYFEQAVAIERRDARAWGLLAYSRAGTLESGQPEEAGPAVQAAQRAARTALTLNPKEPNALTAMILLQSSMLDWSKREDGYRRILAIAPDNTHALTHLGRLLHGVGRSSDAYTMNERAIALDPLSPTHQLQRALRLWVLGRIAEAVRVSDRTMELWPSHRLVRMARLMIYAFTDRPGAALALVDDEETRPRLLSPAAANVWRVSLTALEERTPSTIEAAKKANVTGAKGTPAIAAYAILILSALGELDAAFDVANGFLLARGSVIVRPNPEPKVPSVNIPGWRNTYGLFVPPSKAMRLDPRFGPLCDGLGLTEYWRKRGIGPDPFLFKA